MIKRFEPAITHLYNDDGEYDTFPGYEKFDSGMFVLYDDHVQIVKSLEQKLYELKQKINILYNECTNVTNN